MSALSPRGSDRGSRSSPPAQSSNAAAAAQQRSSQSLDELYYSAGSGSGSNSNSHSTSHSHAHQHTTATHNARMSSKHSNSPPQPVYSSKARSPSWDPYGYTADNYYGVSGSLTEDDRNRTVRLPRTNSHSQLLSLLTASMADASSLAGYPTPPYPPVKVQDSPPKRVPRVPAPVYKSESEPEVWPLTRELVNEFKEYARRDAEEQQATASPPVSNSGFSSDRARKAMSFQLSLAQPNPLDMYESMVSASVPASPPTNSPPIPNVTFNSPAAGRPLGERPLPNPPTNSNPQRTQPVPNNSSSHLSYLLGLTSTKPSQAYSVPLPNSNPVSPAMSGSTLQSAPGTASNSSGSPPFAFDNAKAVKSPQQPPSTAVVLRKVEEPTNQLIDDRDEGDDDMDKDGSGSWHVISQPPEDLNSPIPSSILIQTESDDQATSMANTPRVPAGGLPDEQSSIQQLLMALQLGSQPSATPGPPVAPRPTYPSSEFAPTYPSFVPFERYPSRQASVGGPPLDSAPNNTSYAKLFNPIPRQPTNRGRQAEETPRRPSTAMHSVMSASPYPGPLNPFLPFQYPPSHASSPSHIPLPLDEPRPPLRPSRPQRSHSRRRPPSESGASTAPLETESEAETEQEPDHERDHDHEQEHEHDPNMEGDDVWLDEPSDAEMEGPFHPDFIKVDKKRRLKFEQKWRNLVRQFRELDNMTDSTMFLIANNPDQRHTHLVLSRGIMKHEEHMFRAQAAQQQFAVVAEARRQERAAYMAAQAAPPMTEEQRAKAAFDQLANLDVNALHGEDNLKQVLGLAITSIKQLHDIYEEREVRRKEEQERQMQEQTSIHALLQYMGLTSGNLPALTQ